MDTPPRHFTKIKFTYPSGAVNIQCDLCSYEAVANSNPPEYHLIVLDEGDPVEHVPSLLANLFISRAIKDDDPALKPFTDWFEQKPDE